MIKVGHHHELTVLRAVKSGFYLDAKNLGEVLLPSKYAPIGLGENDSIEVFLYLDTKDQPTATTETPKARVGEFAYLDVVSITSVGAFLDWGLEKDVLVPFAEQHRPMVEGHAYLVYLYLDKIDGRIAASSKIDKFLIDEKPHDFKPQQAVDLIIANSTDLGFKAIINHSHWGVLYKNDVHQRLSFGQSIKGYIQHIRADGKIDLSLQGGQQTRDEYSRTIETYLENNNGFAPLHDKSDPQLISKLFGMSKRSFKNAIGSLYKQKIITIEKEGIRLIGNDEAEIRVVEVSREPLELYKILKFEGMASSGGEAKAVIADGQVLVNDKMETQKRKKIVSGDIIEFGQEKIRIQLSNGKSRC